MSNEEYATDAGRAGPAAGVTLAPFRSPRETVSAVVSELRDRNRALFAVAVANLCLAVLFTALLGLDGRTLLGRNVWTKPWKFATSIAIFTATMAWILPSLSLRDRVERFAGYTIAGAMTIEIVLISTQAARAVPSHFNNSTPLDAAIFAVMGVTITLSTLVVAYMLWRTVREPPALAPAYRWGLGLGMFLFVVTSFEGWLMVARGGHAVGAPADSPGLPLLNWSMTGGDLRIAHFVGLHSLQVLPLTGYVASRWRRLSSRGALGVVGIVAALYGGLTVTTFVVAMRGHPLVASLPVPSWATVFGGSFLLVAPFWGLMILAPTWSVTERVVDSPLVALPAAGLYALLLLPQAGAVASAVLTPSLAELIALLAGESGAVLAWAHFLAFDLFVGRWIYLDAGRRGSRSVALAPVLVATLLFGPVGFLGYLVARPFLHGE